MQFKSQNLQRFSWEKQIQRLLAEVYSELFYVLSSYPREGARSRPFLGVTTRRGLTLQTSGVDKGGSGYIQTITARVFTPVFFSLSGNLSATPLNCSLFYKSAIVFRKKVPTSHHGPASTSTQKSVLNLL